jgi:hypothetical protein
MCKGANVAYPLFRTLSRMLADVALASGSWLTLPPSCTPLTSTHPFAPRLPLAARSLNREDRQPSRPTTPLCSLQLVAATDEISELAPFTSLQAFFNAPLPPPLFALCAARVRNRRDRRAQARDPHIRAGLRRGGVADGRAPKGGSRENTGGGAKFVGHGGAGGPAARTPAGVERR